MTRDGRHGYIVSPMTKPRLLSVARARAEISAFLERTVHLFLEVKVRPNWLEEPERYTEMGLDFKDGNLPK